MMNMMPVDTRLAANLTRLADRCAMEGAIASTIIYSKEKVVVFYKDPQNIHLRASDAFDEFHVELQKNAWFLIAVFPERYSPGT